MKACIDQADPYTPRFNRTFLEYANYRGFLPDPARPAHPKDKPVVENSVPYVRQRFFKGETFIDLDDVARRALIWCREVAGRRVHGTTRRVPLEVFEAEEKPVLIPLQAARFDTPTWALCKVHPIIMSALVRRCTRFPRAGSAAKSTSAAIGRWCASMRATN